MTKIKICGLSRPADVAMVNEALPDYIGFVFAKSKRQVNAELANRLKEQLNPRIQAVGVFVNEDIDRILSLCREGIIDVVQLHGDEEESYIKQLKASSGIPIIKAVRVRSLQDIRTASTSCDYLLLDTYQEDQYGGSGEVFDWGLIKDMEKPFFLAGGINCDNVAAAVQRVSPFCIDVSSGVETDGFKDSEKIRNIVTKVRSVV